MAKKRRRIDRSVIGKREANKIDKLNRIRDAAAELFSSRGFDDTTMRDIAGKAKVAPGTLFLYASNKRDLLFLIANDLMEEMRLRASQLVRDDNSVIENYLAICILHFEAYGEQSALFKLVLRELLFYDTGKQGLRATRNRAQLLQLFADIVEIGAKKGEVVSDRPAELVGWLLFSLLQAEIRRWIALKKRDLSEGIEHLWATASIILNGILVRKIPPKATQSDIRKVLASLFSRT